MNATLSLCVVYDATSLLGFGLQNAASAPRAEPGFVLLRYGGWSLQELRDKRSDLMHDQNWYDRYPWASEKLPCGLYALRLPVPYSKFKTFADQRKLLLPGEEPAHVVLAASALLSIRLSGHLEPLRNGWTRTGQQAADGYHTELDWDDGRLYVGSFCDGNSLGIVWLSSARRLSREG